MSMLLNDEQRQLHESAQSFLAAESPVPALRRLRDTCDPLGYDPALWRRMAEMGWPAAAIPEQHGGLGFGYKGLGAIFEEAGRRLSASPMLSSVVLCGELLINGGSPEQQARWLPGIVSGEAILALALEETGRHDPRPASVVARSVEGGWVLDGEKKFVIDGHVAHALIVVARMGDEAGSIGIFLADPQAEGVEIRRSAMIDSRNAASVRFSGVRIGHEALLGDAAQASAVLDGALDRARVCLAAEALGIISEAFERTVAYLKERVQFDVKIGSFQALQHRAARLYTEIELLRSCVAAALEAIDLGNDDLALLASLAKGQASDLLERTLNEAVQMHGGIGVTDELDIGLFLKRGRVIQHSLGDGGFHRDRYMRLKGVK